MSFVCKCCGGELKPRITENTIVKFKKEVTLLERVECWDYLFAHIEYICENCGRKAIQISRGDGDLRKFYYSYDTENEANEVVERLINRCKRQKFKYSYNINTSLKEVWFYMYRESLFECIMRKINNLKLFFK